MIDHDRLFKALLTTFFVEFVELFFPAVAGYLQPDTVTFLDKELFTDIPGGERREADVVVRAQFRDQPAFFLVHIEHQAEAEAEFSRRMFRYFTRLYEKYALPVYPIVLFSYDTPVREQPNAHRVGFPDLMVLDFSYRVVQLNRLNWRDFVRQPNPVASALMAKMGIAAADRPRVKLECLRLLTGGARRGAVRFRRSDGCNRLDRAARTDEGVGMSECSDPRIAPDRATTHKWNVVTE